MHSADSESTDPTLFTLYVSKSDRDLAVSNFAAALNHECFCPFQLVIRDVESDSQLAEQQHITSTPTLVCECGEMRKVLEGDFSGLNEVREALHRHS